MKKSDVRMPDAARSGAACTPGRRGLLRTLGVFACGAALAGLAGQASAEGYPSRPIRIVTAFTVGATDTIARLYAQKMSDLLGQPLIVEAKPGAGQILAIRTLQQAAPDGYTLYMGTGSALSQSPGVRKDLPYDPLKDFTPLGLVATTPGVVAVNPALPAKNLKELIALGVAPNNKLNYGSAGVGIANHLQTELLMNRTGARFNHVPYKNDVDMIMAVAQNDVQFGMTTPQTAMPLAKGGKVRIIAVTSHGRMAALPDVPGLDDSGVKGLDVLVPYSFFGLVGPAGMQPAVVAKLNRAINEVSAMPEVAARLRDAVYAEPAQGTPAEFGALIASELAKWREVGKTVKVED